MLSSRTPQTFPSGLGCISACQILCVLVGLVSEFFNDLENLFPGCLRKPPLARKSLGDGGDRDPNPIGNILESNTSFRH